MHETAYPHVSVDAEGIPRIDGTRFKVIHLAAEHYYYGWSADELLENHPDLGPEQVYAALAYFYDHYDRLVAQLQSDAAEVEGLADAAAGKRRFPSRDELLRRMSGKSG